VEAKRSLMSNSDCFSWVSTFSLTHTVLRDNGQARSALSLSTYDVLVMDRYLKITYRGGPAKDSAIKSAVMAELANLIP
jgi:hypothetical protein